jgi:hypothetical protein
MSLWLVRNGVANVIFGLIPYGIGRIHSHLESWRLLFIILGAVNIPNGGTTAVSDFLIY